MKSLSVIFSLLVLLGCQPSEYLISPPEKGFVTTEKATKWEESLLTGNGTLGAMVIGEVNQERIILSHEKLFMPQYPPYLAPDLGSRLSEIRDLIQQGEPGKAAALMSEAGKEVGIDDMIWTNPLVPACQLEIQTIDEASPLAYNRGVNYETGEASVAWTTSSGSFRRDTFASQG